MFQSFSGKFKRERSLQIHVRQKTAKFSTQTNVVIDLLLCHGVISDRPLSQLISGYNLIRVFLKSAILGVTVDIHTKIIDLSSFHLILTSLHHWLARSWRGDVLCK